MELLCSVLREKYQTSYECVLPGKVIFLGAVEVRSYINLETGAENWCKGSICERASRIVNEVEVFVLFLGMDGLCGSGPKPPV
jgi:hypothetical protein